VQLGSKCISDYEIFGGYFIIYFELLFSNLLGNITIDQLKDFNDPDLIRPGMKDWQPYLHIAKEIDDDKVLFLIARMERRFVRVKFSNVLKAVQRSLSMPWTLLFDDTNYELSAKLSKFVSYTDSIHLSNKNFTTMVPVSKSSPTLGEVKNLPYQVIIYSKVWKKLANKNLREEKTNYVIVITKLFFCTLIELKASEYIEYENKVTLMSRDAVQRSRGMEHASRGNDEDDVQWWRTLENGEFLTLIGADGKQRVRICLDEIYDTSNEAKHNCVIRWYNVIIAFMIAGVLLF